MVAAAALQGRTELDRLDEAAWWQADDFWQYALFAAVGYIRAASQPGGRAGAPGMPGPGLALWPPSALTTTSAHSRRGYLTGGRS